MKRPIVLAALLLASGRLVMAQPPPAQQANATVSGPQAELVALQREYQLAMNAFYTELQKTPADFQKAQADPARNPGAKFAPRALAIAQRGKGTPTAVRAKLFAFQASQSIPSISDPILKDLLANDVAAPEMEQLARALGSAEDPAAKAQAAKTLEMIEQKSPIPAVRAAAINARIGQVYDSYMGSGEESVARTLAQKLTKEYADTPYGKRAGGLIFQIDNLGIGKTAPDIQAEDQDGVVFKLSDYRGKVVVLDFWGWW